MTNRTARSGVVVGVDGSAAAHVAVRWAAREAALRNVPLTIVCAIPPLAGTLMVAPLPFDVLDRERTSARAILEQAAARAKSYTDGSLVVTPVMPAESAVPALCDMSEHADLVVVGRSGHGAIVRALLGSVSSGVLHHGRGPIAVIPEDRSEPDPRGPIVVGVDGSNSSDLALDVACREAWLRGVDLVALHAWWTPGAWEFPHFEFQQLRADLDGWLRDHLAPWQARYPQVTMRRTIARDQPARHLIECSGHSQLIVVGSHGRGGFSGVLLGSVSRAVVHAARAPVIVVRER